MLQTPTPPRKQNSFLTSPIDPPGGSGIRSRSYSSYMGLPAKYPGYPNYMQYRIGTGAELEGATLSNADLRWRNFRSANLRRAKFCGSILWGSTMTNADLSGADISHADFTGVDLVGTNLTNTKTEGTCFLGARYSKSTRFPKGFGDPEAKGLVSLKESMQLN